jgi:hypothetical protein
MKKIIEQVKEWSFLSELPAERAGFKLSLEHAENGSQFTIFTYCDKDEYRSFTVLYDKATKDFLARINIGLTEFFDISFITTDLAALEKVLTGRLAATLDSIAAGGDRQYESIFRDKKILEWAYGAGLPAEMAGFSLFIAPRQALKTINGSYIIIDYSDFAAASNLAVCYNIYRDEFFGGMRLNHAPRMTALFDARELDELADKLNVNLEPTLRALRDQICHQSGEGE